MEMLADRCDAFYHGKVHEAKSAAAVLSTLLSERGQKSLLGQLGLKLKHRFLDSRHRNGLCRNSARGSWPVTVMPFSKAYREQDLVDFDEWWGQTFQVWYRDIIVTREDLVSLIRNKEGGGHVDPKTVAKLAAVRQARSGWQRQVTENEDGTTQMYVGISLSRKPLPEDSGMEEISDYELACIIAIAEEVLFSLTPEPENRLRMHDERLQKPFYLTQEESDKAKMALRGDLEELEKMGGNTDVRKNIAIDTAQKLLLNALKIECLTAEDYDVREYVSWHLKRESIPWDRECE